MYRRRSNKTRALRIEVQTLRRKYCSTVRPEHKIIFWINNRQAKIRGNSWHNKSKVLVDMGFVGAGSCGLTVIGDVLDL